MSDTQRLLEQAIEHQRAGRGEAAEWLYRAVLALDIEHAEANHHLGILEIESGQIEPGLEHLQKAVERAPEVGGYWLALAEALLLAKRPPDALVVMDRARKAGLDSQTADALRRRIEDAIAPESRLDPPRREAIIPATAQATASPLPSPLISPAIPAQEPPSGTFVVSIAGDVRVRVPADIHCLTTYALLEQEDWFEDEISWVRQFVQPGMVALDVGANHGIYALTMAKLMQGNGRVIALEPTLTSADLLAQGIIENGLADVLTLIRVGLSGQAGEADIAIRGCRRPNSPQDDRRTECVPMSTLDDLLGDARWPTGVAVDFLRLNVGGQDLGVLQGGNDFFMKQTPLVMFRIPPNPIRSGLMDAFAGLNMEIYRLIPGLNALVPFGSSHPLDEYRRNLFACGAERANSLRQRGLML
ncbi:FkbM family methyltransferase [Thiocystis violascens]|uniref:Methyltransferase, FkbM family n=1 Tax=Thiocystis violascens (strain ATCC 17096 / DSM 198 / 6111) TaxID=765911 RepID=I3Y7F9_THIV6|nr:FkbM family methyltransferase [Thiocystis violascens]AFL72927.1 methyltransferase, FkbM family [Thiocystis violascens DSM 198]